MLKNALVLALFVLMPTMAFAEVNNIGSCGWGSKLFEGNRGVAPQVLGATTNGTFGNQTFGISSATSGCTRDSAVHSNWKAVAFIDSNMNKLARDMSSGNGETLDALANLLGMDESVKPVFFKTTQAHFGEIFSADDISSQQVADSLHQLMEREASLSKYAQAI